MTTQASIPNKWYVPFANGDGSRVEIPVTTTDATRASQTLGFPPLTMQPPESGGVPPQGEDFNGAMNQVARVAWWVLNGGGWPYDASFATNTNINGYPNGATVQASDFRGNWINTTDGNTNNPDTTGTNWVPGFQYGVTALTSLTGGTVTPTPIQAAKRFITLSGTLTSALTIVLPTWTKEWTITNNTTGAFVTIVKTAAGSGVTVQQNGQPTAVMGDGTNIISGAPNISGRLLRTTVFTIVSGTQQVSVDGGAFTATGAGTFTALSTTQSVTAELVGGGGAGGGTATTAASQSGAGTGGSSGAYALGRFFSAFSGLTVTAGAAGVPGAAGNVNGGAGGTSSFGALVSAPGGPGGVGNAAQASGYVVLGSNASSAPSGGNIVQYAGAGSTYSTSPNVTLVGTSTGGSNPLGSGGRAPTSSPSAGNAGSGYGSGASGTLLGQSQSATAGTAGQPGAVIIREYS